MKRRPNKAKTKHKIKTVTQARVRSLIAKANKIIKSRASEQVKTRAARAALQASKDRIKYLKHKGHKIKVVKKKGGGYIVMSRKK